MTPDALLAAYDLLLLELRAHIGRVQAGGLAGALIDLGDELVEGQGWRGSDARRVVAALQFDLREAARHWLGASDDNIDWQRFDPVRIEACLLEHLADPQAEGWATLPAFAPARRQLGSVG